VVNYFLAIVVEIMLYGTHGASISMLVVCSMTQAKIFKTFVENE
jgi:hypothetical protein